MDYLDEQEFYEVCQRYRHAKDWKTEDGRGTASQAFEALKDYIRQQHTKALPDALAANALLIAENRRMRKALELISSAHTGGLSTEYCKGIAKAGINKHGGQS